MCRLVAYVGAPFSPAPLVFGGDHSLWTQSFNPTELLSGSVNADGYGVVWYAEGVPARVGSPFPIWHDQDLEGLLESVRTTVAIAALRNITTGIPPSATAVPPLVLDKWSFVFNGYLKDFGARFMRPLHALIPDPLFARLTGVSDTEALFLLAVAAASRGDDPAEALASLVRDVTGMAREEGARAQLNMVLSDGERVVACRASSTGTPNSLYVLERGALAPEGVILASERLDGDEGWAEVPPQTVVDVTRNATRTYPIGTGAE